MAWLAEWGDLASCKSYSRYHYRLNLHLLTKLSQSRHVVYHVQPNHPCWWVRYDSVHFSNLSFIFIVLGFFITASYRFDRQYLFFLNSCFAPQNSVVSKSPANLTQYRSISDIAALSLCLFSGRHQGSPPSPLSIKSRGISRSVGQGCRHRLLTVFRESGIR